MPPPASSSVYMLPGVRLGRRSGSVLSIRYSTLNSPGSAREKYPLLRTDPERLSDEHENTPAGNYVVFSDLTDTNLVLTAKGGFSTDGNSQAAINAIQIVPFEKSE